jgi:hypothetical protein
VCVHMVEALRTEPSDSVDWLERTSVCLSVCDGLVFTPRQRPTLMGSCDNYALDWRRAGAKQYIGPIAAVCINNNSTILFAVRETGKVCKRQ